MAVGPIPHTCAPRNQYDRRRGELGPDGFVSWMAWTGVTVLSGEGTNWPLGAGDIDTSRQ